MLKFFRSLFKRKATQPIKPLLTAEEKQNIEDFFMIRNVLNRKFKINDVTIDVKNYADAALVEVECERHHKKLIIDARRSYNPDDPVASFKILDKEIWDLLRPHFKIISDCYIAAMKEYNEQNKIEREAHVKRDQTIEEKRRSDIITQLTWRN